MKTKPKAQKIEMFSDAWSRFTRAVDVVAKSPPQHRTKKKRSPPRKGKKRRG